MVLVIKLSSYVLLNTINRKLVMTHETDLQIIGPTPLHHNTEGICIPSRHINF